MKHWREIGQKKDFLLPALIISMTTDFSITYIINLAFMKIWFYLLLLFKLSFFFCTVHQPRSNIS